MKRKSLWGFLPIFCILALPLGAQSRNELVIGNTSGEFGSVVDIPITLNTTDEVQGLVVAADWNSDNGTGEDVLYDAAIADADTVVKRVEPGYVVIGVVMDSDGMDNEIILPGDNLAVATLQIRCGMGPDQTTTPIEFRDGTYATVDGGPELDNIVVVGGLSISVQEDLILTDGSFTCTPTPPQFSIADDAESGDNLCGDASVLMRNLEPVEGYVVALCHDADVINLTDIAVGAAANAVGAEFEATDISAAGGTIGVVLDFQADFDGQVIEPGSDQEIAVYTYCCNSRPEEDTPTTLSFCDNELGSPVKENVIVVGGRSISTGEGLQLVDGVFTCKRTGPPPQEDCNNGIDDDGDGLIDLEDPDCQQSFACEAGTGSLGGQVEVDLLLKTPEDNKAGHAQEDHVQGFSMAISYCCELQLNDETLDISGTILEAIGAEFVSVQADNTEDDGDGCEVIVGVLVDALPPFDGATIPPMEAFQKMGTLTFDVADNPAACGTICEITFVDGLNGSGVVPVKNLISVENRSKSVALNACSVEIVGEERFFRGDCNFSNMGGMSVDISDAAAVVSYLFLTGSWKFNPPCLDACDCNDDGRLDLADAICVLQYYLLNGEFPKDPGPGLAVTENGLVETGPGPDPTDDKLDCDGGTSCDP